MPGTTATLGGDPGPDDGGFQAGLREGAKLFGKHCRCGTSDKCVEKGSARNAAVEDVVGIVKQAMGPRTEPITLEKPRA